MSRSSSLGHMPQEEKWSFDKSVTECFEDMLLRSIPQYDVMRKVVFDIGSSYVKPHTALVDLGCSRGDALAPFVEKYWHQTQCIGVEVSPSMLDIAQERFGQKAQIRSLDLRTDYPEEQASLTLSVFTLQFTPIEYRQQIVRRIYQHTIRGGAFVLIEKILGASADIDALLVKHYYALKAINGYSQQEIERKRLSLEGILVPVTAKWNEEILQQAGFQHIDCFWRYLNFAGWIAIKEG